MPPQTQNAPALAVEMPGDLRPLLEQLGSPDALASLAGALDARPVRTFRELRAFLLNYHSRILRPLELPAIQRAFGHASRHELRELLALDRQLAGEPLLQNFSSASTLAGRNQLERLQPLRDERMIRRYLAAVDEGVARGWHTLVYGLTLAIYSWPLRQGLLGYARQTTRVFIQSASPSLNISDETAAGLFHEICDGLPESVDPLLTASLACQA